MHVITKTIDINVAIKIMFKQNRHERYSFCNLNTAHILENMVNECPTVQIPTKIKINQLEIKERNSTFSVCSLG